MIISFQRNLELNVSDSAEDLAECSYACSFDSDFLIGFEGKPGHTLVLLSTGHVLKIPDCILKDLTVVDFHKSLQSDLVGRANKRLEQAQNSGAHTVAVQQYNRVFGEIAAAIKQARENDEEGPTQ